ncbi:MAG: choice-of-anchor J domain-containing protein [Candidatus Cloacimonas sp.]|jgi:hypothetical protein|nr:choice-of-anchor J domain-containing protein [Candidatus Cloacimonas sp.]
MRPQIQKLLLLLIFSAIALGAWAIVNEYSFASTLGTYTEISGGTIHGTATNDNENFLAIPLGFTFTYNGVDYTEVSIQTNGFIAMGAVVVTSNIAISSATSTNNVVAALNRDIKSRDTGELMSMTSGTAPNRVFTAQWKHYKRVPTSTANDDFSFQIQLQENGNKVQFVYGSFSAVTATTAASIQVGLRGDSNTDYFNRTTATDWSATTAGTAANNSCTLSATVFPANGLTFTFSPAVTGEVPLAAQNPNPANNAVNVAKAANLVWNAGGGITDGYKVYLGTDNPPTNLVNGTSQTAAMYDPADFSYNTMYYWKVVPFNTYGDAINCPVWSFTTLSDPTVTSYPYVQNFDAVTAPALPLGWTVINANNDAYAWESYAGNFDTTPNSMRIRYNTTVDMDDWLVTPPMQLTQDLLYKVKFFYRSNSATYQEKLSVYWGTSPTAASMTNLIYENLSITNITYNLAEAIIPVTTSGTVYIGFHGHSALNMFYLYLDTFSITELTDTMDPPTNLSATVTGSNVHLAWTAPGTTPPPVGFTDGFETYPDFSLTFAPWTLVDVDLSATYGMEDITWLNGYAAMAYIIFNPSATVPAITDLASHSGAKMACSFASTTPPNNDWMITPQQTIAAGNVLKFWAKSYTAEFGLERFKVGVSTTGTAPANFTIISGATYVSAPVAWTEYTYALDAYAGQQVYLGIQCLSNDAFIFAVDDVFVGAPANRQSFPAVASLTGSGSRNTGTALVAPVQPTNNTRALLGYKVYRNDVLINTIDSPTTVIYDDLALAVGTYSYKVTANYDAGQSVPAGPVSATISPALNPPTNVAGTVDGNDVTLTWTSPEAPQPGAWITWCNDVLGNGIGTGDAFNFDVAHRWAVADLAAVAGGTITQVKFVPNDAASTYTIKIWTGGSATTSGTLVYSQLIANPVIGEWNLHVLNTPVPIPANAEVYVGFNCNATGGYPAGCDNGPQIEGKGNMIYSDGEWAPLTALAPTLTYNWLIQTFVASGTSMKAIELKPIAENHAPNAAFANAVLSQDPRATVRTDTRAITGFKVYRNAVLIGTINDPAITTFADMDLPNATYTYGVSAVYTTGESVPANTSVTVNMQLAPAFFTDGFESYADFANLFAPWTLLDQDLSATYGITDVTFPGSESPMAFIIFNPSTTTPPITSVAAHGGAKMAASIASTTVANNDWLISPRVNLGTGSALKFYARSMSSTYLESMRVGVSTIATTIPQGFQYYLTGATPVVVPAAWTEYIYDLSSYDGQSIYIAIRNVSNDKFIFFVDDFSLHSVGGSVGIEDGLAPVAVTELKGNYPNPFNPETTIRYSMKDNSPVNIEIYNLKGQKVKTLVNETKAAGDYSVVWKGLDDNNRAVSSGVYFFKMSAGKYSSTKKMIMMK